MRTTPWIVALAVALAACTQDELYSDPRGERAAGARDVPEVPGDPKPSGKELPRAPDAELERFVWHDGATERSAWLDPHAVADHDPSASSRAALLARAPGAEELAGSDAEVRLWRLPPSGPRSTDLCRALRTAAEAGRFSPIFHATPDGESPRSSLPGGVIASFSTEWTIESAERWLAARGLAIERRLDLAHPTFVVGSPPGLAALELANELFDAPEVRWAEPDWWIETAAK